MYILISEDGAKTLTKYKYMYLFIYIHLNELIKQDCFY